MKTAALIVIKIFAFIVLIIIMTFLSSYTESPAIIHWPIGMAVFMIIIFYKPKKKNNIDETKLDK
ncbi:MAG TPA: hypothetical protein PLA77_03275 [Bacteroidales bacterium]|nr:hypothetical protein [Bacteroidales bacterium]